MLKHSRWRTIRQYPALLFLSFAFVLLISGNVQHVLFLRPTSEHQWRQCDGASQALNYYQNDIPFLTPQYHSLLGENGHGASEFPIVYYVVAQLYNVFGFHEYIFRIVSLILFLTGIFCLFKAGLLITKNPFLSLIPPAFFGLSPVYFFYADNFLPNVPAISFSLMGYYFFFKYIYTQKPRYIFWYSLFFALAALIKVSESIGFLAIQGIYFLGLTGVPAALKQYGKTHIVFKIISLFFVAGIVAGWVLYAKMLNEKYHNSQSLLGIIPIWKISHDQIMDTCGRIMILWLHEIHSYVMWGIVLLALFYFIRYFRQLDIILKTFTIFIGTGALCYSILWFEAFFHHDYYIITTLIFPCFILVSCIEHIARTRKLILHTYKIIAGLSAVLLFVYFFIYNFQLQQFRYSNTARYPNLISPISTIEPYLRSIGISRFDKVVSVPDISPSNTLYLMNNPGWTEAFNYEGYNIKTFVERGAQYLVIADSSYLQNDLYKPYLYNQIGNYKGALIFKL